MSRLTITARLSSKAPTSLPTSVTVPVFSTPRPSSSSLRLSDLPIPTSIPAGLRVPFEAPSLIVTMDKTNPTKVVGNGYTAQLSATLSTVFAFDVGLEYQGKMCNLVFYMPPPFPFADLAPVKMLSPGGISVSRLSNGAAATDINAGSSAPVGVAPSIQFTNQYPVGSAPCEAGQRVAYQVDSIGGLTMDFFQMTSLGLGLFMIPS